MRGSIPTGRDLLSSGNKLKLGLFGFNCSNALSLTLVDTTYKATWDHTLAIARYPYPPPLCSDGLDRRPRLCRSFGLSEK